MASITSLSKPSAMPLASGMIARACEKILVDRIGLAVNPQPLRHFRLEPSALLGRIGQFAEAIGELDPAGIEFEALGETRVLPAIWRAPPRSPDSP